MNKKIIIIVLSLLLPGSMFALKVEQVRWGFNGKVLKNDIAPLSVLLSNPTDQPFEGAITLNRFLSIGQKVGAPLAQPFYLTPYSKKWLQFYPFILNQSDEWSLSFGDQYQRILLPPPKFGAPATVYLHSSTELFPMVKMPIFPDELFPTSVSATSTLYGVLLDYSPRFTPAQSEAFHDWVLAGGQVFLNPGRDGTLPTFTNKMSFLNKDGESFHHGAGTVYKLSMNLSKLGLDYWDKIGFELPKLEKGDQQALYNDDLEELVFRKLKMLVRTKHNWTFIYLLIALYMIIIGPVNFLIGRKSRHYLRTISFFIGTVAIFTLLFSYIGRRGYGERSVIHDLGHAKWLSNDEYDVSQWTNVFTTNGDYYEISNQSDRNYYSACQQNERVNGVIRNGKDGFFKVDIPLYSSRHFWHRGKLKGQNFGLKALSTQKGKFIIKVGENFPAKHYNIWAFHRGQLHILTKHNDELISSSSQGLNILTKNWWNQNQHLFYQHSYHHNKDESYSKALLPLTKPLVFKCLGGAAALGDFIRYPSKPTNDIVKVFIVAKTPKTFNFVSKYFKKQNGLTLFEYDLPLQKK